MTTMWKRSLCVLMVASMALSKTNALSQTTPVDLKSAIDMALANNYSLKADKMNIQTAIYQKDVVKADYLPQVNYSNKSEYNPNIASQMLPGKIAGQPDKDYVPVQFGTRYAMSTGIEVNQNLYRKDLRLQTQSAAVNVRMAQTKHALTKEEIVYQVAASYYDLQTNAELIRTTRKDYENILHVLKISKAQTENGMVKRIDYESLQINAANKESQLNQYQSAYNVQLAYFKYLLGLAPDAELTVAEAVQDPSATILAANKIYNREDLHLNRQMVESKELEIKTIRAEKLPQVSLYSKFSFQAQYNNPGDVFKNDYWYKASVIGISTKISLFDGYRRKSRISIAESQLQQLKFEGDQKRQLANADWASANEKLANDLKQLSITRQNLALAEKVFASRTALYAEGVSTLIELLDADRELSQARNNHVQAMINVATGVLNTHKANGTILTEYINTL